MDHLQKLNLDPAHVTESDLKQLVKAKTITVLQQLQIKQALAAAKEAESKASAQQPEQPQQPPTPPDGVNKLKGMGLDAELADKDTLDSLTENGSISAVEKAQILQAQAKHAANKKPVPVPGLPEMAPLTETALATFQCPSISLPQASVDSGSELPNVSAMSPADWLTVFIQCNLGRATKADDPSAYSSRYLLLPPNDSLLPVVVVSQISGRYIHEVSSSNTMNKTLAMAGGNAFAKVQTPWVSTAVEFSMSTEKQTYATGETYTSNTKYVSPIAEINLHPDNPIQVDSTTTRVAILVNPEFRDDVERALTEAEKMPSPLTAWIALSKALALVNQKWGEVFPTRVEIGVACYRQETKTCSQQQSKDGMMVSLQAAASGGFGPVGVEVGGGYQQRTESERGTGSARGTVSWTSIGGNDGCDPSTIGRFRHRPEAWRCVHVHEYCAVFDLLPRSMRDRMKKIEALSMSSKSSRQKVMEQWKDLGLSEEVAQMLYRAERDHEKGQFKTAKSALSLVLKENLSRNSARDVITKGINAMIKQLADRS